MVNTELAAQGFEADLVERGEELGGNLRTAYYTLEGGKPQELLRSLIERVGANEMVKVYLNTEVRELGGSKGNYTTRLALADGSDEVLQHGAIIVATGAQPVTTSEYLYGQHERVVTQKELEEQLSNAQSPGENAVSHADMQTVVMIQCVGSRDENRPYCSRVCCSHAVKNALKLKELNPEVRVFVLYRELRTYGFHELYYREARDKGVVFVRYELPNKPHVEAVGDGLRVRVREPILGADAEHPAEIVLGRDGVVLRKDGKSAVYLPQVATEQGWTRDEMLDHLCRKAGLAKGCWRDGARLLIFQSIVFGEHELGPASGSES